LLVEIRAARAASKGTYGAPRLEIELADAGIRVSRKRIARLMRNRRPGRREPSQGDIRTGSRPKVARAKENTRSINCAAPEEI
jgi:transposase InsO family protein